MPNTRPTLTAINEQIKSDIVAGLGGGFKLLRRSILSVLSRAYSGAVHLLFGSIEYNKAQLFITSSDHETLPLHGSEYGVTRNPSTKATGSIYIYGTDGKSIPANSELESDNGQSYLTDSSVVIASGVAVVSVTAKEGGYAGNEDGGVSLSFVSPIIGVQTSAVVTASGIDGGADEEELEDYRSRVLSRKRRPPHGGAKEDYENWMREVSGVTRAWAIPLYQGIGTIGCAFVRDNDSDIIPSESEMETVKDYIISHTDPITGKSVGIPVTARAGLYMIPLTPLSVNFTLYIYPNTSEVQEAVTAIVSQSIVLNGGPNKALYKSELSEAISSVPGENRHELKFPSGLDYLTAASNQVHVPGTITFEDYNG